MTRLRSSELGRDGAKSHCGVRATEAQAFLLALTPCV